MRIRKNSDLLDEELDFLASVSDAFAHPVRLKLYRYIMQANKKMEDVCNRDLVNASGYAQATISQHMKKLVSCGLVEIRKKDKFTFYYANFGILMKYVKMVKSYSIVE
jgi:ArsR family transcriptional regulator